MQVTRPTSTAYATGRVEPLPEELNSPRATLVYLYLAITGGTTLDDMKRTLRVPKVTLLSVLDSLSDTGLVERDGDVFVPA